MSFFAPTMFWASFKPDPIRRNGHIPTYPPRWVTFPEREGLFLVVGALISFPRDNGTAGLSKFLLQEIILKWQLKIFYLTSRLGAL